MIDAQDMQNENAALRQRIATLEAENNAARAALFACGDMGSKTIANGIEALDAGRREWHQMDAGRIAALEVERNEARDIARAALYELTRDSLVLLEDVIARWDAEGAPPAAPEAV